MSIRSRALRTGIPSLVLVVLASPIGAQALDSLAADSTPRPTAPLAPELSAPARSFGSVRHTVDSSAIAHGVRPRTLSELLQARLPGVSVLRYGGDPSDGARVRVRGTVSLVGDAAPVVVVDGIPVNTPERLGASRSLTPSSRLDDFDPEEIERIDVLPGPAATTLFGAGASNGAIVLTTKRGSSGRPRWNAWSQGAMTSEPATYPANYNQNGTDPVTGAAARCLVIDIADGLCTPTTLDMWSPLEGASPFRHGRYAAGGGSVAGGPLGIKAFASATARAETSVLDDSEGSRVNGRLNVERELLDDLLIGGNVGYVRRDATIRADHVVLRGVTGSAVDDENRGYRTSFLPEPSWERAGDRLSRSARMNWRAVSWLRVNALVGRDELTQDDIRQTADDYRGALESTVRIWQASSFVRGTAEATHRVARAVELQTLLSYEEATRRTVHEEAVRSATDGRVWTASASGSRRSNRSWMLQERIDVGGEIFVNLGVRRIEGERSADRPGWHPSVDAAWDVGRIGDGPTLRLRGAYAVGVPPRDTAGIPLYFPGSMFDPVGPPVEPEQPHEAEIGVDAQWGARVELVATYYDQRTRKLITLGHPSPSTGAGYGVILANMANRGAEIGARVGLLDDPRTRWTASATLATLRNRVSQLRQPPQFLSGPGTYDGQPFGTVYEIPYTFIDADADGLPDQSEISRSAMSAAGAVIPTREASLRSELELRRWGITLAAALDHRGGHHAYDVVEYYRCAASWQCRGWHDPGAPLDEKVRAIASIDAGGRALYLDDASYTRLGEVALVWAVPERFGRVFGNGLTLIVEGRNVATWTKFTGPDPEVATSTASSPATAMLPMLPAVPRTLGVRVEWR